MFGKKNLLVYKAMVLTLISLFPNIQSNSLLLVRN